MSLKSLVNDGRFDSLSDDDKRSAVFSVEPRAKALKPEDFNTFISKLKEQKEKTPVVPIKLPKKTAMEKAGDVAGKAFNYLSKPEELARKGLTSIAESIPEQEFGKPKTFKPTFGMSGKEVTVPPSVLADVIEGSPKVIAETLAEVAPEFVSRESILTAGASKALPLLAKPLNVVGKGIGRTLESLSGLQHKTPGVLAELTNDPALFIGKGKDAARELYKAVQNPDLIRDEIKMITVPRAFIRKALTLVKGGDITPEEALEARKVVDEFGRTMPAVAKKAIRNVFDLIAKQKFEEADKAYARAVKSEAVRSFFGFTKSGDTSTAREFFSLVKPFAGGFMSPMVQGAGAASVGVAKKAISPFVNEPVLSSGLTSVIESYRNKKEQK